MARLRGRKVVSLLLTRSVLLEDERLALVVVQASLFVASDGSWPVKATALRASPESGPARHPLSSKQLVAVAPDAAISAKSARRRFNPEHQVRSNPT